MKREREKHKPYKNLGYVTGASPSLAGISLNMYFESWMALKLKWNNRDDAWKYCELKEETRHFWGARSRPLVPK